MQKIPKWKTDKVWALRRAKRKGKLPESVEVVFLNEPEHCLEYSKITKSKLPLNLEQSIVSLFEKGNFSYQDKNRSILGVAEDKLIISWLLSYAVIVGRLPKELEDIFVTKIKDHLLSPYGWGCEKSLKYAKICGNDIPKTLENLFWKKHHCAYDYSMQSSKRIPEKYEYDYLSKLDEEEFVLYCLKMFKGRAPEQIEHIILDKPDFALRYAKQVMMGQLPDAIHSSMILKSFEKDQDFEVTEYIRFVKQTHNYAISTLCHFDKNKTVEEVLNSLGKIEYEEKNE